MATTEENNEAPLQADVEQSTQGQDADVAQVQERALAPMTNEAELLHDDEEDKPDPELIESSFYAIAVKFNSTHQDAMLAVGHLIKREFYKDDFNLARKGEKGACKRLSLDALIERLSATPGAPKKSWIYNAVNLVVEYHDIEEYAITHDPGLFEKYKNIFLSQKVILFTEHDLVMKAEYIHGIFDQKLSIKQLREQLEHNKPDNMPSLVRAIGSPDRLFGGDWNKLIEPESIAALELPVIQKSLTKLAEIETEINDSLFKSNCLLVKYKDLVKQLAAAEKKKEKAKEKTKKKEKKQAAHGTEEWAKENINFSTGCTHGCLYCYARRMAGRRKGYKVENWTTPEVRQHDVDKKRPKYPGRIMFPSSHDLIMAQWDQISIVLGKLLSAGNEVLIVSKPHIEVIEKICAEFGEYKPQMFFRFTIGSMDDKILTKWEPGAPHYEERKQSLKYAREAGFSTSVSCEPMVDADHLDDLIADLRDYVSDTFWIGKMDFHCVRKESMDMEERKRIQKGQTNDNVMAIYDRLKDDPMIRWKDSIKEVVGLERPTESGQDI